MDEVHRGAVRRAISPQLRMDRSMEIELSAETAALAAALTEKDPVTALAGAKLALNSGAEADAALQALDAAQLRVFFHCSVA